MNQFKKNEFKKYFSNTSWLMFEKSVRLIFSTSVSIWTARYLGPENFGRFSYAQSIYVLFAALVNLGMDEVLVRDFVEKKEQKDSILFTSLMLRLLGGVFASFFIFSISFFVSDLVTSNLILIIGASSLFQFTFVIDLFLQSQVNFKSIAIINSIVVVLSSLLKIFFIQRGMSVIYFGIALLIESIVLFLFRTLLLKIWKFNFKFRFLSKQMAYDILKESWPLLLAGLIISAYIRIDQVMLKHLLGEAQVGIYSASVRISEAFYFFPMLVSASLFPSMIELRGRDQIQYEIRLRFLFSFLIYSSIGFAIFMTLASHTLILMFYGVAYAGAAEALLAHVWGSVFVSIGIISSKWFVIERLTQLSLFRSIVGLFSNVLLNYFLIPKFGALGAAWATVISQFFATMIFDLFYPETRILLKTKLESFNPISLIKY